MSACTNVQEHRGVVHRCWKCASCKRLLAWLKVQRIGLETLAHKDERSWFLTFTFATVPTEGDGYREVQLWLKRLRFGVQSPVRYIMIPEWGPKHGRLHYHGMVWCERELKYREFPQWPNGHSRYKIAKPGAWEYIVKYLSKGTGKVRASSKLGLATIQTVEKHPMVVSVLECFPRARIDSIGGYSVSNRLLSACVSAPTLVGDEEMIARMSKDFIMANSHAEDVYFPEGEGNDD